MACCADFCIVFECIVVACCGLSWCHILYHSIVFFQDVLFSLAYFLIAFSSFAVFFNVTCLKLFQITFFWIADVVCRLLHISVCLKLSFIPFSRILGVSSTLFMFRLFSFCGALLYHYLTHCRCNMYVLSSPTILVSHLRCRSWHTCIQFQRWLVPVSTL